MYYHYYEGGGHGVPKHDGVRDKRYKLIHFYTLGQWEMFDLESDPQEMKSVYDDPKYATQRQRLEAELVRLRRKYEVPESDFVVKN